MLHPVLIFVIPLALMAIAYAATVIGAMSPSMRTLYAICIGPPLAFFILVWIALADPLPAAGAAFWPSVLAAWVFYKVRKQIY